MHLDKKKSHSRLAVIGDTHSVNVFNGIAREVLWNTYAISVGDNGIGFFRSPPARAEKNVGFLFGNHDNRSIVKDHPNFLGPFGVIETLRHNVFYLSGAYSPDVGSRTEGVDWWRDEELSYAESSGAIDLASEWKGKINIVVSHDCPSFLVGYKSHTGRLLDEIYRILSPRYWYYGHHHVRNTLWRCGTRFTCVGINEVLFHYDDLEVSDVYEADQLCDVRRYF